MIYDFFTWWWASLELLLFLFGIAGVYLFCSFRLGLFTRGVFFYWAPFNYWTFSAIFWIFYYLLIWGSAKMLFCLITFFCFSSWSIIFSKLARNSFLFYLTPPCSLLDSIFFYPWFIGFGKITTGSLFTSGFLITYSFLMIYYFLTISFLILSTLGSLSIALTTFFESTSIAFTTEGLAGITGLFYLTEGVETMFYFSFVIFLSSSSTIFSIPNSSILALISW